MHDGRTMTTSGCPHKAAEQSLTTARNTGDRRREAFALADLGIMHLYEGDAPQAVAILEDALAIVRQLSEPSWEADILGNWEWPPQPPDNRIAGWYSSNRRWRPLAAPVIARAKSAPWVTWGSRSPACATPAAPLAFFSDALALARDLGDWQHEAELLWYLAIQHAALGQRDEAIASGQAAVDILERMDKPQAGWFAHHLASLPERH